jgi:hypothetical protein
MSHGMPKTTQHRPPLQKTNTLLRNNQNSTLRLSTQNATHGPQTNHTLSQTQSQKISHQKYSLSSSITKSLRYSC